MLKNSILMLISNVLMSFSQWLLFITIVKVNGLEEAGLFSLAQAVIMPLVILSGAGFREVIITDKNNSVNFTNILAIRAIYFLAILSLLFFSNLVLGQHLVTSYLVLIYCSKYLESISDLYQSIYLRDRNIASASVTLLLRSFYYFISIALLYITESLLLSLGILFIFILIHCATEYILHRFNNENNKIEKGFIKNTILLTKEMMMTSFVNSLGYNIPRYVIDIFYGSALVAIYTAITQFIVIGRLFVTSICQVSLRNISQYSYEKDIIKFKEENYKISSMILLVGCCLVGAALAVGDKILLVLYSKDILDYSNLLTLSFVVGTISYLAGVYNNSLTACREFATQRRINVCVFFLGVSLYLVLGFFFSLTGVLVAMGVVYIAQIILTLYKLNDTVSAWA